MVLPPWSEDAELARPYFRRLRELRDRLIDTGAEPTASRAVHGHEPRLRSGD